MGLMNNTIQIVINLNGSILDKSNAFIANINENYNAIQIIAPFPVTDSVAVNYDLRKSKVENYTQYLVPLKDNQGNYIKANQVVDSSKPYYQTVSEWYVWQNYISSKALAGITTWHAGKVYISVSFKSYKDLYPQEAITYKGTFGLYTSTTRGDLPSIAESGDYFKCMHYSYHSNNADLDFTNGDLAIWYDGAWSKSDQYELRIASQSTEIGIDASILSVSVQDVESSITDYILERLSFLENVIYEELIDINYIVFNKDYTPIVKLDGMLYYDNSANKQTLTFVNTYENGETMEVNIGKELFKVVKNVNGYLTEGTPVTYSDVQGDYLICLPAKASYSTPELNTIVGVLTINLNTNQYGPAVVFGEVDINDFRHIMEDNDDSMLDFGSKLYLSTTQDGRYTTSIPTRPDTILWIATVLDFNSASHKGSIVVYPQRLSSLGESISIIMSTEEPTTQIVGDVWFSLDE